MKIRFACVPEMFPYRFGMERQAAAELVQLFVDKAGVKPEGRAFTVTIGVADGDTVDVRRLEALPNNEQAYAIRAEGQRLFVSGLGERGVYYGVRTLCQLLEPVISTEQVRMPLAQVVDWPDMDERGLWNFPDPPDWIPWLAEVKLNYGKMASTQLLPVERDKPNDVLIDGATYRAARRRAFNYVPYILHLNFLKDVGLFRAYPTLAGKGDEALTGRYFAHKQGNQHRVPCASNPLLANILCEWMEAIGAQGADEISCWLSERPGQCGCEACTAEGQFVLEARSFVRAWEEARQEGVPRSDHSHFPVDHDLRARPPGAGRAAVRCEGGTVVRNRTGARRPSAPRSDGQSSVRSQCLRGQMGCQLRCPRRRQRKSRHARVQGAATLGPPHKGLCGATGAAALQRGLCHAGLGWTGKGHLQFQYSGAGGVVVEF